MEDKKHLCQICNTELIIAKSDIDTENDNTPDLPTVVVSVLDLVCHNPKCSNYCGLDLSNPKTIVESVRNPIKTIIREV